MWRRCYSLIVAREQLQELFWRLFCPDVVVAEDLVDEGQRGEHYPYTIRLAITIKVLAQKQLPTEREKPDGMTLVSEVYDVKVTSSPYFMNMSNMLSDKLGCL